MQCAQSDTVHITKYVQLHHTRHNTQIYGEHKIPRRHPHYKDLTWGKHVDNIRAKENPTTSICQKKHTDPVKLNERETL